MLRSSTKQMYRSKQAQLEACDVSEKRSAPAVDRTQRHTDNLPTNHQLDKSSASVGKRNRLQNIMLHREGSDDERLRTDRQISAACVEHVPGF